MRIMGVDFSSGKDALTICISDNIDGNISFVHIEQINDVISEKQAIKLCKQIYKRFGCDKVVSEDLEIKIR